MPSVKVLEAKKAEVAAISERLQNACAGVIVDYKGINVADDTALRKELREAGVEYTVTKNTMIELAIKGTDLEGLGECLAGTTALATHDTDVVAPAKILSDFITDNKEEAGIAIKAGFMEGRVVSLAEIDAIAKVPSKDTLYAMIAGGLNATIAGFARAVNAVKEQKEQAEQSA